MGLSSTVTPHPGSYETLRTTAAVERTETVAETSPASRLSVSLVTDPGSVEADEPDKDVSGAAAAPSKATGR